MPVTDPQRTAPGSPVALFAARARSERRARSWTLADVAGITGISPGHLSRIELLQCVPSLGAAALIADAFGVSLTEMIRDRDSEPGDAGP